MNNYWKISVVWLAVMLLPYSLSLGAENCPGGVCPTGSCPPTASQSRWNPTPPSGWMSSVSEAPKAACKVIAVMGRQYAPGSGVLIRVGEDFGLVLSCAHGPQDPDRREIVFPATGERFTATQVAVDHNRDVSILRTQGKPSVRPIKLSTILPSPGDKIYSGGWGQEEVGEQWGTHPGQYLRQESVRTETGGLLQKLMTWRGKMRMGDSGGPVWNSQGSIIGVNSSSERPGAVALASGAGPDAIRDILARYDACAPAGTVPPLDPVDVVVTPPVPNTGTQDQIADLQRQIDELKASGIQGPPGPQGPQGEPGTVDVVDNDPLFYVIHRNPDTGEVIPQVDPSTGESHTVQPINRGDDWTIYFHSAN